MSHGPLIHGQRTLLRPVTPADLPFLQALWNDGAVMQHVGFPAGLDMTEEKMARWWEKCQSWTATHLLIETPAGTPLGESGWGFMDTPGMLELKLAPSHWGQGYAADALGALLDYLFRHTTIEGAVVTPHRQNAAARRLYRGSGFQPDSPSSDSEDEDYERWTLPRPHPPRQPGTLIFDWGGVLMRTEDDGGRRRWEAKLGLPAGGADRAVFQSDAWRRAQLGQCSVDECWEAIGASLGLGPADLARFRHDFWAGDRLNRPLLRRIGEWKAAGYRVALLSNYSLELEALLDEQGVRGLFDPAVISAQEGVMKPGSHLFWRALNRMGASPADALLVDDFYENVTGARNVGLHAVHFRDTHQTVAEIEEVLR
jgi:FMN phosphatase YigB (HAD superfamily)/RimJ/RimL family protein N-acetyltransferase